MDNIDIEHHIFNDDLLINTQDLDVINQLYPPIAHILDHPELRETFKLHDKPANYAKSQSRQWGYIALFLGVFSLLVTSAYPLYKGIFIEGILGLIAAISGVLSVPIGYWGLLYGKAKRKWLYNRLMTERLRQFHFQTLVCRLPEILESLKDEGSIKSFKQKRANWYAEFNADYEGKFDARFSELLNGEGKVWLLSHAPISAKEINDPKLDLIFSAYQKLRIEHQIGYANYMLRKEGGKQMPVTQQALLISKTTFLAIIMIFLIHLVGAFAIIMHNPIVHHPVFHTLVIWLAVLALATRALAEGWQPEQEISRYNWYKTATGNVQTRFNEKNVTSEERLRLMEEMERLSFEEMKEFMRCNNKSRFIM